MKKRTAAILILTLIVSMIPVFSFAGTTSVTTKSVKKSAGKYTVQVSQNQVNSRKVVVKLPKAKSLKKARVYKVKTQMYMTYKGKAVSKKTRTAKIKDVVKGGNKYSFYAPAYGRYKVVVKFYNKKGKVVKKISFKKFGVVAEEYNIAVLTATMGPLMFSINSFDAGVSKTTGKSIPTMVSLTRYSSYDWKNLPKNMNYNPLLGTGKISSYTTLFKAATQYVADLKSVSKYAKFHFYMTDFSVKAIMDFADKNNLSQSQYDVQLYTDGTGSYEAFNSAFGGNDAQTIYNKMVKDWNKARAEYRKGKDYDVSRMTCANKAGSASQRLRSYAYVAAKECPNVTWNVLRKDGTFDSKNADFLTEAKTHMNQMDLKAKLTDLQSRGLDGAFKKMYHFNSEMFANAKGKDVLVLMGSRVTNEKNFVEFASFVKKYYGSGYAYYYKGHPATPTKLYPQKQKDLANLGITDIESSIPAELILFFYPSIYVSGESNSTLNESYVAGHCKVYKGTRIAKKDTVISGDKFEAFFTKIDASYEDAIKNLCTDGIEGKFLVEFTDTTKHDIAIYDYNKNTITYYILQEDGTYLKEGATILSADEDVQAIEDIVDENEEAVVVENVVENIDDAA